MSKESPSPLLQGKKMIGSLFSSSLTQKASLIRFQNIPQSPSKLFLNTYLTKTELMTRSKTHFYNLPEVQPEEKKVREVQERTSGTQQYCLPGQ